MEKYSAKYLTYFPPAGLELKTKGPTDGRLFLDIVFFPLDIRKKITLISCEYIIIGSLVGSWVFGPVCVCLTFLNFKSESKRQTLSLAANKSLSE